MDAYESVMQLESRVDPILMGSGSGVEECTGRLFNEVLSSTDKTVVIDADALKLVDRDRLNENVIVTPHEYEFKVLFGENVPEKLESKIGLLSGLSAEYGATILLKGVVDVIASGDDYKLNRTGNQGMTIGGTGDLLAGLTLALAASNPPFEAAYLASFILGRAADKVLEKKGWGYGIGYIINEL